MSISIFFFFVFWISLSIYLSADALSTRIKIYKFVETTLSLSLTDTFRTRNQSTTKMLILLNKRKNKKKRMVRKITILLLYQLYEISLYIRHFIDSKSIRKRNNIPERYLVVPTGRCVQNALKMCTMYLYSCTYIYTHYYCYDYTQKKKILLCLKIKHTKIDTKNQLQPNIGLALHFFLFSVLGL